MLRGSRFSVYALRVLLACLVLWLTPPGTNAESLYARDRGALVIGDGARSVSATAVVGVPSGAARSASGALAATPTCSRTASSRLPSLTPELKGRRYILNCSLLC
jgi:hypothetical protein